MIYRFHQTRVIYLSRTPKPEEEISSIIIYDDEDDPININADIQHPNDPITDKNDPHSFNTKNSADILRQTLDNTRDGETPTNTVIESVPTHLMLHPIIFNSGMMTVPSLSANIVNGKLVTNNNNSLNLLGTPHLALQVGDNLDFISDPNKVTNVLRVLSHQDVGKVHIFTSDALTSSASGSMNLQKIAPNTLLNVNKDGVSMPNLSSTVPPLVQIRKTYGPVVSKNPAPNKISSPPNKIPTVLKYSSTSKNPSGSNNPPGSNNPSGSINPSGGVNPSVRQGSAVLRTDRIDWEDKIPMDVISFVVSF